MEEIGADSYNQDLNIFALFCFSEDIVGSHIL